MPRVGRYVAGALPTPGVGSVHWFVWRLPLLILFSLTLVLLVAIVGPIEIRSARRPGRAVGRPAPRLALVVAGFAAVTSGMLGNSPRHQN